MIVKLLTEKQKESLIGIEFMPNNLFNPIEDNNGQWVITLQETKQCTNINFMWVRDLPEIDFEPKPEPDILT